MTDANILLNLFNSIGFNILGDPYLIGIACLVVSMVILMFLKVGKFPMVIVLGFLLIILGLVGYLPQSVLAVTGLAIAGYSLFAIYGLFAK